MRVYYAIEGWLLMQLINTKKMKNYFQLQQLATGTNSQKPKFVFFRPQISTFTNLIDINI